MRLFKWKWLADLTGWGINPPRQGYKVYVADGRIKHIDSEGNTAVSATTDDVALSSASLFAWMDAPPSNIEASNYNVVVDLGLYAGDYGTFTEQELDGSYSNGNATIVFDTDTWTLTIAGGALTATAPGTSLSDDLSTLVWAEETITITALPVTPKTLGRFGMLVGEGNIQYINHGSDEYPNWKRYDELRASSGAIIRPGTVTALNPYGLGYEIVCSASYVTLFMTGFTFQLQQDGLTVRSVRDGLYPPDASWDETRGMSVGVRWFMDDGSVWECFDATATAAVWDLVGSSEISGYPFTQVSPSALWIINHNLGYNPTVAIFRDGVTPVEALVSHPSANQTRINFLTAISGTARLI